MTQLRRHSFLEACLNTATGFLVSCLAWPLICRWVLHVPFHAGRGLGAVAVFTVLSVARNYLWRRIFNRRWYRRQWDEISRGEWLCPEHAAEMLGLHTPPPQPPFEDCQ